MTQDDAVQCAINFANTHQIAVTCVKSAQLVSETERPSAEAIRGAVWVVMILCPSPHDPEHPLSDYCLVEVEDLTGEAGFFPTL